MKNIFCSVEIKINFHFDPFCGRPLRSLSISWIFAWISSTTPCISGVLSCSRTCWRSYFSCCPPNARNISFDSGREFLVPIEWAAMKWDFLVHERYRWKIVEYSMQLPRSIKSLNLFNCSSPIFGCIDKLTGCGKNSTEQPTTTYNNQKWLNLHWCEQNAFRRSFWQPFYRNRSSVERKWNICIHQQKHHRAYVYQN